VTAAQIDDLTALVSLLETTPGFEELVAALDSGNSGTIDGAWGSSSALAMATVSQRCRSTTLVVLPREADLDDCVSDLESCCGKTPVVFPAWASLPQEAGMTDAVFGRRLRVLRQLAGESPPDLVVATITALLQPVPSRDRISAATRRLSVGDQLDEKQFYDWLTTRGFESVTGIQLPGEFAVRGGIVDVFPPDADDPYRIEFFGDEIESIRQFDAGSQRTVETLDAVEIVILGKTEPDHETVDPPRLPENPRTGNDPESISSGTPSAFSRFGAESFFDALPDSSWVVLSELSDINTEGRQYLERLNDPRGLYSVESILSRCTERPSVVVAPIAADGFDTPCHLQVESIEKLTGPRADVLSELAEIVGRDERVLIACHNSGEIERLSELFAEQVPELSARVTLCTGHVAAGFRLVPQGIVVLSDHELFNRTGVRRQPQRRRIESRAIDSFIELQEGHLVVHVAPGIARFQGMTLIETDHEKEEHLELEFRNNVRLYVPVSLIHLVQKYVGGAKSAPELSVVGGSGWSKKKARVAEAVADLASDMIQLQAQRQNKPGIACPPDSHWNQEFAAAFPYTETPDQVQAIEDCRDDLEATRPMDRLICGDVGYGKTEVALRAAFKVIDAGRQVAVLVPTTVLAEQHHRSFTERLAEFPVTIESLSRFKTKKQQRETVDGLKSGVIDIVVGTHRLVSKDVQFKNLGLLVIDEEQRFGVDVKEALKRLRLEVDVLTLSATPIPRTLHLSLLGIRDISNLTTAPEERLAVTTRLSRWDADLIRSAIVRELNRNGQVYFVHNRVHNIHEIENQLRSIVPEATFDVVHGQMAPQALEAAMLRFVRRETDVLIATTIIESGVDIPNANTMFIHQADIYGLADLHQLRGRVGRYRHRAYCYLLLEEGKSITPTAAKRLKAIEEFSELGAGFRIAMRDLEIRGAGNILGTEQSGHIASVGYELYCQLLESAVRNQKAEPPRDDRHVTIDLAVTALIPSSYVPPGKQKIEVYRRLSALRTVDALRDFETELRDRFGPIPAAASRLLVRQEVQLLARMWKLSRIHLEDGYIYLTCDDHKYLNLLKSRMPKRLRIIDNRQAVFVLKNPDPDQDHLLRTLKKMLQPFS